MKPELTHFAYTQGLDHHHLRRGQAESGTELPVRRPATIYNYLAYIIVLSDTPTKAKG